MKRGNYVSSMVVCMILISASAPLWAGNAAALMTAHQMARTQQWLSLHKQYRLATDADCGCEEDANFIRKGDGNAWLPQPGYHPYFAVSDFNQNRKLDFSVVVTQSSDKKRPLVLVFLDVDDRPFLAPLVHSANVDSLRGMGLFVSSTKPARLLFGAFNSEAVEIFPSKESQNHHFR
jgi:hypothetical protein